MNASAQKTQTAGDERTLEISRVINAPREKIFKAWTDTKLLKQWWAPRPWTTPVAEIDLRTGGVGKITMRSPEGQDFSYSGVYLEVIPNEKIVVTDAYTDAWTPSEKAFFTAIITLEDIGGGKTKYTATARHWNAADCEAHAKMGFIEGWGQCAAQLAEVAEKL